MIAFALSLSLSLYVFSTRLSNEDSPSNKFAISVIGLLVIKYVYYCSKKDLLTNRTFSLLNY